MILDFDPQRCLWTVVSREAEIAEPPEPLLDLSSTKSDRRGAGTATEELERLQPLDPSSLYRANTLTRKLNALTRSRRRKGHRILEVLRRRALQLTFLRTEDEEA